MSLPAWAGSGAGSTELARGTPGSHRRIAGDAGLQDPGVTTPEVRAGMSSAHVHVSHDSSFDSEAGQAVGALAHAARGSSAVRSRAVEPAADSDAVGSAALHGPRNVSRSDVLAGRSKGMVFQITFHFAQFAVRASDCLHAPLCRARPWCPR